MYTLCKVVCSTNHIGFFGWILSPVTEFLKWLIACSKGRIMRTQPAQSVFARYESKENDFRVVMRVNTTCSS